MMFEAAALWISDLVSGSKFSINLVCGFGGRGGGSGLLLPNFFKVGSEVSFLFRESGFLILGTHEASLSVILAVATRMVKKKFEDKNTSQKPFLGLGVEVWQFFIRKSLTVQLDWCNTDINETN